MLIAELLDIDTINESEEGAESLIQVTLFFVDYLKSLKGHRFFLPLNIVASLTLVTNIEPVFLILILSGMWIHLII
jgi:hypothetical protein